MTPNTALWLTVGVVFVIFCLLFGFSHRELGEDSPENIWWLKAIICTALFVVFLMYSQKISQYPMFKKFSDMLLPSRNTIVPGVKLPMDTASSELSSTLWDYVNRPR